MPRAERERGERRGDPPGAGPDGRPGPSGAAGGAGPWPVAPGTALTLHGSRVPSR